MKSGGGGVEEGTRRPSCLSDRMGDEEGERGKEREMKGS